ncbi:MAG: succinylglutamate desuccinylase/aspartoacylase family protein [Myxococcales bacterium]|nr:succinylglutamate desuccinylase/aspartoacylase family protein [Myxococcales bacterium]MCB9716054.1 succinylglutamate desuccinylase/aspartoacylase family protein [Myxococcales bacterium]
MFSALFNDPRIRCVEALRIEDLPAERVTRVLVDLTHDGMGRATRLPVIVVKGRRAGPIFGITAALHGNELNGIPVVHRLVAAIDPAVLRGALVVVPVLNIPGLLQHAREFADGTDLNHIMPGHEPGSESRVYAARLIARVINLFDYLADLHTASFGRVNTLYVRADLDDPITAHMALLQRPSIVLHSPPMDHTLRGWVSARGGPAITVEIGNPHVFQPRQVGRTLAGLRAVLSQVKMLPGRHHGSKGPPPTLCEGSRWIHTDMGGLLQVLPELRDTVQEGQVIARQVDIFGDLVREYASPCDGIVIGKSVDPVSPTGARIVHLGTIAPPGRFPGAEALLREESES